MIYAGIGSRQTPKEICLFMGELAHYFAFADYTLRSGGAKGADTYFERGCDFVDGNKEIYIPWNTFNNRFTIQKGIRLVKNPRIVFEAQDIAKRFHPNWDNLRISDRAFHTRNVFQIVGKNLRTPADFCVCWTKDGGATGGTGQALRIAKAYNIPIYNLFFEENVENLRSIFYSKKMILKNLRR